MLEDTLRPAVFSLYELSVSVSHQTQHTTTLFNVRHNWGATLQQDTLQSAMIYCSFYWSAAQTITGARPCTIDQCCSNYHNTKHVLILTGTANIHDYFQDSDLPGCFAAWQVCRIHTCQAAKHQSSTNIKFRSCCCPSVPCCSVNMHCTALQDAGWCNVIIQ
jgi:hypothetical protein